jgi:hypothetical protein
VFVHSRSVVATALALAIAAPVSAQEKEELKKCDKPFGALAVNEPQQQYMAIFRRYSLGSPAALLRSFAQHSKCFIVVERGVAMQNIQQERALANAGQAQQGSNMGEGQMKLADFVMTATIQVVDNNAGGIGGVVASRLGGGVGALGGGVKFKEAETSLLVSDVRTTVQVAAAEGKARKTNFSLGALGIGGALVGVGAYSNTAEGKVIAASYLDNWNKLVDMLKADPAMVARADKFKPEDIGAERPAGATFAEGDVLGPKIDNVKLLAEPVDGAKEVAVLKKTDDLVFLGTEKDGFVKVQGSAAEGWVKKTLVAKR